MREEGDFFFKKKKKINVKRTTFAYLDIWYKFWFSYYFLSLWNNKEI
jgi:hypothetical protein